MLIPQIVVFHEPKDGNSPTEWEDGAGHACGDAGSRRPTRCVVVDGATEAYDAIRWARQLVRSFVGDGEPDAAPALTKPALLSWFATMQDRWRRESPITFGSYFEQRKFEDQGSFATFLGCEIDSHAGIPHWTAASLGDAVLFQVRGKRIFDQFPAMDQKDFGLNPEGISTQPNQLARMSEKLDLRTGSLEPGDRLYLATDAMAHWLVGRGRDNPAGTWPMLSAVEHPELFRRIVQSARSSRRMHNDDVTLIRIGLEVSYPRCLVVCQ